MHKCRFCQREDFPSPQSFYAHLKWCPEYLKHKQKRKTALGTASLREAVPKAQPQAILSPIQSPSLPHLNDPFAPFKHFLQDAGVPLPNAGDTEETPHQSRRRLLQTAKNKAIDQYWSLTGTVTAEMRAAARLAMDRELRNEPLEEFSPQEVIQLAEGIRDRVYTSFRRRQEKEVRRTQEEADRKHANQRDEDRRHTERTKKKAALLVEAQRRVVTFLKTRSLSPLKRLQVLEEVLSLLDETLTGDESLSEAYAVLDTIQEARAAELDAHDAAREAKRQREWQELATVVVVIIAFAIMYVKGSQILQWLLRILSPGTAEGSGSSQKPSTEASTQSSDEQTPQRPIRRVRRPPQSRTPESSSFPSKPESDNPYL